MPCYVVTDCHDRPIIFKCTTSGKQVCIVARQLSAIPRLWANRVLRFTFTRPEWVGQRSMTLHWKSFSMPFNLSWTMISLRLLPVVEQLYCGYCENAITRFTPSCHTWNERRGAEGYPLNQCHARPYREADTRGGGRENGLARRMCEELV